MTLNLIVKILLFLTIQNPISIFNGVNLDGWKVYGTESWYVKDSELICESGPDKGYGYLATEKYYKNFICLLYTSPSPRDRTRSRMPSSA